MCDLISAVAFTSIGLERLSSWHSLVELKRHTKIRVHFNFFFFVAVAVVLFSCNFDFSFIHDKMNIYSLNSMGKLSCSFLCSAVVRFSSFISVCIKVCVLNLHMSDAYLYWRDL